MKPSLKCPAWGRIFGIILIGVGSLILVLPIWTPENQSIQGTSPTEKEFSILESLNNLAIIEGNSFLPIADFSIFSPKSKMTKKIKVVVTAYSSTPWETDDSPFLTAAGTEVRDGIVANNFLPIGTKIRIPELFGDKIFVVEDRMSWEKGNYHIDIWFSSYWEALNFGAKRTYIEILEN